MTTLQEAAMREAFEAHWLKVRGAKKAKHELARHPLQPQVYIQDSANRHWVTWQAALAQHREQQPVCHGCGIPAGDVHMSTCKSGKWPSRVSNGDTAAPAPAPHTAQPLLAHEVLKLNALWNKSSVKDSAIADQLAVCRVLAESEDDMELTDAQILTLWEETYVQRGWTGIEFARAIERAHGIGVKQ